MCVCVRVCVCVFVLNSSMFIYLFFDSFNFIHIYIFVHLLIYDKSSDYWLIDLLDTQSVSQTGVGNELDIFN